MKFSEQWLREWVQPSLSTQELVDQITMAGLEVDSVDPVAGEFTGVVVAEITACEQHPDADKLRVCQVSDGQGSFQVVCGAPNARTGLKVPFATVGARLPGDFKIKKAKLRGVESFGMLCAQSELGLAEQSAGLMELPADAPVGDDIRRYLALDDVSIDVDLTPNRGDCLSIAGLAREVGVLSKMPVQGPSIEDVDAVIDDRPAIDVQSQEACPRYVGRLINDVDLASPTPVWMVEKLRRSGIRSIDAIVDITNYVLLELGQPMHAFDAGLIDGGIVVRHATAGEALVLLDGQEVNLSDDTLVIADHNKALAIAGVMGGEHSGVNANTKNILLEAAFFNPITIAGKARSYGLHTDSSHRFERGVDYELAPKAMARATQLVLDICGGKPGPVVEVCSSEHLPTPARIELTSDHIKRMLSLDMARDEVTDILQRLGLGVEPTDRGWHVIAPSYRFDMSISADLVEELARIYGYNNLPVRTPSSALPLAKAPEQYLPASELRRVLMARGYQEAITYSFVEPELQETIEPDLKGISLLNPISSDMSIMRTSLWAGLLNAASYNLNRQQSRVRLFETGLRFVLDDSAVSQSKDQPLASKGLVQTPTLAMLITGDVQAQSWSDTARSADFFDIKGDLESLLARTGEAEAFHFEKAEHPALHPGQSARVYKHGQAVGWVGALHPNAYKAFGIKQTVLLVQIDLSALTTSALPVFAALSKHPEVSRDLAVLADLSTPVSRVMSVIKAHAGEHLLNVNLFDVYTGKGIDNDRKSLALGLTWQHPSRTLTDEEVNNSVENVLNHLNDELGVVSRG